MDSQNQTPKEPGGLIVGMVKAFLTGPLSILFLILATALGVTAILTTPREEEPQIVVPMADVFVNFPGHSAEEVEQLVTTPLERMLREVRGVEHVYSISYRDRAMVTARFFVGEDETRAMVRVRDKINANLDRVPPGVTGWQVSPVKIEDVAVVTLTLHSPSRDGYELRRIAEEMKARLAFIDNLSNTRIVGGYSQEVRVEPDAARMASRGICVTDLTQALRGSNQTASAGVLYAPDGRLRALLVGPDLASAQDVEQTVVSAHNGHVVRIEDVADVISGAEEPEQLVRVGFGPATPDADAQSQPAVTLAFSKKTGTNAVTVAREVIAAAEALRGAVVPDDVQILVSRDYGRTSNEKVNDLLTSMALAIGTVFILLALTLGWREAIVVGVAVPVSFALALFVNELAGFTINRVTLFALILSLGLVVDDPITNVDNIQRHILMGRRKPFFATLAAVHEVIPPVLMSTLVIIVCFLPMSFITGMMGPYMEPMAINLPLTVSFSTLCALTIVPWLSYRLLRRRAPAQANAAPDNASDGTPEWIRSFYRRLVGPFLHRRNGLLLIGAVAVLFALSCSLFVFRQVPLKILPYDNKSEFQLVVDMPEGSSLEQTDAAVRDLEAILATVNEVTDWQSYVGTASPIDFNGLVRHYGMRQNPYQADIRVNLAEKNRRVAQSHAITLRLRDRLTEAAVRHGAALSIVETPPGPPVLSTITVELYAEPDVTYDEQIAAAKVLRERLHEVDPKQLVQIDDWSAAPHEQVRFVVDRNQAALHGLTPAELGRVAHTAVAGEVVGLVHEPHEREPTLLRVRLPRKDRFDAAALETIWCRTGAGDLIQVGELGAFHTEPAEQPIYHKNLKRVVFVTAEVAGTTPAEVVLGSWAYLATHPLPAGVRAEWAGEGEWQITMRVFRDLGLAFGAALVGIYLLMTVQTGSFFMPLIIMSAIPLTVIGIAPGFFLLNLLSGEAGGYADPTFFTATAMIGMIALGGIVIRNSIVLIEFIQDAQKEGQSMREAILASGAVRFRPIVLTAGTTLLGAWPITMDPIFSGLAWALIFGLLASTAFTLVVIPTVYYMVGPRANDLAATVAHRDSSAQVEDEA